MNLFCRNVLRVLLENLEDEDGTTRSLVFGVLTEMLKQVRKSSPHFSLYLSYTGTYGAWKVETICTVLGLTSLLASELPELQIFGKSQRWLEKVDRNFVKKHLLKSHWFSANLFDFSWVFFQGKFENC
jgi:hypothetical protein